MEDYTDQPPPAYSATATRPGTGASNFRHKHRYALQDKSGSDWVSFKVKSRAADPKHTPLVFGGDIIEGEVQLNLAKTETLKDLTITVCVSLKLVPCPLMAQLRLSALTLVSLPFFFLH
jgi:hypothetical protein